MLECKENSYTKPTANLAPKFLFKYTLKRNAFFHLPINGEGRPVCSSGGGSQTPNEIIYASELDCWYDPNPNRCFNNLFGIEDLMSFI